MNLALCERAQYSEVNTPQLLCPQGHLYLLLVHQVTYGLLEMRSRDFRLFHSWILCDVLPLCMWLFTKAYAIKHYHLLHSFSAFNQEYVHYLS